MEDRACGTSEWKDVPGYEGLYIVSRQGVVRSVPRKCISYRRGKPFDWLVIGGDLKGYIDRYGYQCVLLSRDGKPKRHKVHRVVCITFHGQPPEGCEVGHLDGNSANNRDTNLAWITRFENIRQREQHRIERAVRGE
ncbi:MAG: NUMOD4 motif-containing HNH endonuclease [Sphingobium sp.]